MLKLLLRAKFFFFQWSLVLDAGRKTLRKNDLGFFLVAITYTSSFFSVCNLSPFFLLFISLILSKFSSVSSIPFGLFLFMPSKFLHLFSLLKGVKLLIALVFVLHVQYVVGVKTFSVNLSESEICRRIECECPHTLT